jgi:hypothetical protein
VVTRTSQRRAPASFRCAALFLCGLGVLNSAFPHEIRLMHCVRLTTSSRNALNDSGGCRSPRRRSVRSGALSHSGNRDANVVWVHHPLSEIHAIRSPRDASRCAANWASRIMGFRDTPCVFRTTLVDWTHSIPVRSGNGTDCRLSRAGDLVDNQFVKATNQRNRTCQRNAEIPCFALLGQGVPDITERITNSKSAGRPPNAIAVDPTDRVRAFRLIEPLG